MAVQHRSGRGISPSREVSAGGWLLPSVPRLGPDPQPPASGDSGEQGTPSASDGQPPRPVGSPLAFWWLLLIALLGWNVAGTLLHSNAPPVAKIPYSTFVDEVKAGNVASVGIQGSAIMGTLRNPREWNRQTGQLTDVAVSGSGAAAGSGPQSGRNETAEPGSGRQTGKPPAVKTDSADARSVQEAEPVQVSRFTTVFPSSLGDEQLLPLLESRHVEIVAVARG
ncbi:MAG: ATP-dependent metallopeptidase FtsH/Yme1/Tma family protein, partial [Pseudomonadales bacterium]